MPRSYSGVAGGYLWRVPMRVTLGETGEGSIAPTVFALVERAVSEHPGPAEELAGHAVRLDLGYAPVRIAFAEGVVVSDDDGSPVDAEVRGALPDINALIAAPTAAGMPNPTRAAGRAALARLADGRVELDGSVGIARKLLRLLSIA